MYDKMLNELPGFVVVIERTPNLNFEKLMDDLGDQGMLLCSSDLVFEVFGCECCDIVLHKYDQAMVKGIFENHAKVESITFVKDFNKLWFEEEN